MLKLNDSQIERINDFFDYIEKSVPHESDQIKAEVFSILLNNRFLTKENCKSKAEKFIYNSGIYKEIKKSALKTERNKRAYSKKKETLTDKKETDSSDFDEWAFYEKQFNN